MFWFLHYTVKVLLALAIVGLGATLYLNRHWFAPAEDWAETLGRADLGTLPVLETITGRVVRVTSGDGLTVREGRGPLRLVRIAGIVAPPRSRNSRSPGSLAADRSRELLSRLALSNEVRVAFTFVVPRRGGAGGVYLGETNLAVPLLEAGAVMVHDGSLKSLPLTEQVQLLAAERSARSARRGCWTNMAALRAPGFEPRRSD